MVVAHGTGEDDCISFFHGGGGNGKTRRPFTDAGSIEIEAPFAFNNLGVSCYDGNACFSGRFRHGGNYLFQYLRFQSCFQNEGGRQVERSGSHGGQVIHRAADRQFPYITAGKEEGLHHEAVGGKDGMALHHRQDGAVFHTVQYGICKIFFKEFMDEAACFFAARTMA